MSIVIWALLLAVATGSLEKMEPRLWQHELKKTYCQMIQRQRIYKTEQLNIYCAGKVTFFEDMVSQGFAFVVIVATTDFKPIVCFVIKTV